MVNGPALRAPRPWLPTCRLLAVATVVAFVSSCTHAPSPSAPPTPAVSSPAPPAASSSSKQPEDPLPDPAALLKQSSAATKKLTAAHLALSVTGQLDQMPAKALRGDLTNGAAKGTAKITIMGADVDIRYVVADRRLYVALPDADWRDYGPTSTVYNVAAMLDSHTGLANLLADFIDPKAEAREVVAGQRTVRISGKVTAEAVNKLLPLGVGKRTPCTVWIQERDEHQLVRVRLEPGKDDAVEMDLSNWNVPVSVERPAGR